MTQTVTLTPATSGDMTGYSLSPAFGTLAPLTVYSTAILLLVYDAGDDQLRLTFDGDVDAADWVNLIFTGDNGQVVLEFDAAERTEAGGDTIFEWDLADAPFTAASEYSVVFNPVGFNCECDDTTNHETLGELRARMMVRLGYAAQKNTPPPGMADLLNDFLQSAQRKLYRKYPQTRTERFFTWTMLPGVRYYDLPDNEDVCTKKLNALKRTWVGVEDANGFWYPLADGITPTLYTTSMYRGLPTRYEIRQCIEVFPAPDASYKLRIKGHFELQDFTDDADETTVDSELVFLWALADAKAHYRHDDAAVVRKEAQDYLGTLVGDDHGTKRYVPGTTPAPPQTPPTMRDGFDA